MGSSRSPGHILPASTVGLTWFIKYLGLTHADSVLDHMASGTNQNDGLSMVDSDDGSISPQD